ncbi:Tigger transposable element-derived protein 4 [Eumeta japonica]|uniref:Tigger transposable element-derived protein 4 n=1 Tax=Eumeta variegata TaxID=151549 RepID=A0A4C1VW72_EUMVA|nr:Tigger transposable element-derived protein 4 [Eumeta japonica]
MPISGPLVKAKAENFAEELGLAAFKASEGWLGKFKQRHHINYGKISGKHEVLMNMTHDWINNKFLSKAWEDVTPTTIQHSFRHAGLCTYSTSDVVETEPEFDSDDDLPLTEWIQQFNTAGNTTKNFGFSENTEDQEQGDEEDETDEPEPPSIKEALEAAKLLENYFLYHQDTSILQDMNKINVAAEYGLPASTLSTIITNEAEILQRYESSGNLSSKRRHLAEFPDLEECLLTWFKQCRNKNISVSGPIFCEKAEEFSKSLGHSSFHVSNGCCGSSKVSEEPLDSDMSVEADWNKLQNIEVQFEDYVTFDEGLATTRTLTDVEIIDTVNQNMDDDDVNEN